MILKLRSYIRKKFHALLGTEHLYFANFLKVRLDTDNSAQMKKIFDLAKAIWFLNELQ